MKKKFKELKDNQKVLAVFGILGLVLILTGVTYAFFSYTKEGTTENTLKSGSITFWYDEINQSGNSISIEDALPMSDEQGKQQTQAFNFKIQSITSSTTTTIPYEITLRQKQGTDDIGSIVKVYLAKTSALNATIASEEEVELSLFSELSNVTKNTYSEKLLHTDIVPASDSPYTQFYRLKMWIDGNTDYSQVENSTTHEMEYPYNNKTFTVMVNVYANGHVLDGNSATATVNSVSVGGTELTSTTVGGIDTYSTTLPEGTTSTTISVDTGNYDQVTVTKTESDYTTPVATSGEIQRLSQTKNKKVSLTAGNNYFKIVATSEDGTDSKEIHVMIRVKKITPLQGMAKMIYDDNTPIEVTSSVPNLTTSSKTAGDSGFYELDVSDGFGGDSGVTYFFRGNVTNNKVRFAGLNWRIIRINEDGTVRLITENYYNSYSSTSTEPYFSEGKYLPSLQNWITNNIAASEREKIATGDYFCEALKVKAGTTYEPTSVPFRDSYRPDLTCPEDVNQKGLVNSNVGLISYDEVVLAGGYGSEQNDQWYLMQSSYRMSTTTLAGTNSTVMYRWVYGKDVIGTNSFQPYQPVINLNADVTATKDANGVYVVD